MTRTGGGSRPLTISIAALLAAQGLYYGWFAWGLLSLFRSASNVGPDDPVPPPVWTNAATGGLFVLLAAAYVMNAGRIRRWFLPLALLSLLYGIWAVAASYPLMTSLAAAFHGDAIALSVLSGAAFVLIGILGAYAHFVQPRR